MSDAVNSNSPTLIGENLPCLKGKDLPKHEHFRGISRWKASAVHLAMSLLLAIGIVLLLLFFWYPGEFFNAAGGKFLVMILVGVDVVLGPLITLIIFNPKKKSLPFDLAVIAIVQAAALGYGVYTMYLARPAFVVFSGSQFTVLSAHDVEEKYLKNVSRPEYKTLSLTGPKFVFNDAPKSFPEVSVMMAGIFGAAPQFYVPYSDRAIDAAKDGELLRDLLKRRPETQSEFNSFLRKIGRNSDDVAYFPLVAKAKTITVLVDAKTGAILGMVPIDPV